MQNTDNQQVLIDFWTHRMTVMACNGSDETDPVGKEALRFGAMQIYHCIEDLKRGQPQTVQGVSTSQSKHQKSWLRPFLLRLKMLFSIGRYLLLHQGNYNRPK